MGKDGFISQIFSFFVGFCVALVCVGFLWGSRLLTGGTEGGSAEHAAALARATTAEQRRQELEYGHQRAIAELTNGISDFTVKLDRLIAENRRDGAAIIRAVDELLAILDNVLHDLEGADDPHGKNGERSGGDAR